jgi:Domain of Unknown Function (DUF928)
MRQIKIHVNFSRLFLAWFLVVASVAGVAELTGAIDDRSPSETIQFNPPDREPPSKDLGGQTRCPLEGSFQPLVYKVRDSLDSGSSPYFFGLTVGERPTFYFNNIRLEGQTPVYFALFESNPESPGHYDRVVYETNLKLSDTAGVISISLPSEVQLQVGKTYQWYIEVDYLGSAEAILGWIERVETSPELATQLASAETAIDRAKIYAEAGIWYDAIDTLTQERKVADTPELKAQWESLLTSLDLSEEIFAQLVEAPFVEVESISDN